MPPLVRRYLKTAILFLAVGLTIGLTLLVRRELLGIWPAPYLVTAHVHAVLVGFVVMMIFGVALWMFPRAARDDTRYDPRAAEVAYWLVTSGTALRMLAELLRSEWSHPALRWAVVGAALAQVLGAGVFFRAMWSRIRQVGQQPAARVTAPPPKMEPR
ncbi:MAG: cbb3-type cytochrome c oxidase subunit I [Gemmatimonadota bacterium]|nr:cbb3-type cytochrome c oxidase subunit I [Gemmatimonadota bacterium]